MSSIDSATVTAAEEDDEAAGGTPAIKKLSITAPRRDDDREPDKAPLDLNLITRLIGYMRPYAAKRNVLFLCVLLRGIQLPLVGWSISMVLKGPITHYQELPHPVRDICMGAL